MALCGEGLTSLAEWAAQQVLHAASGITWPQPSAT
jgi:hypothetical protein